MKQKVDDLVVLLKNDRKTQVVVGVAVFALLAAIFYNPGPKAPGNGSKKSKALPAGTGATGPEEAYRDLIRAFRTDVEGLKADTMSLKGDLDGTRKEMEENVARTSEILKKMLERMSEQEHVQSAMGGPQGGAGSVPVESIGGRDGSVDGDPTALTPFSGGDVAPPAIEQFSVPAPAVAPPAPPPPQKVAFIGAGDSVRIELLTGVNAPTDGTPYPVMFKLAGDVIGPDGSTLPLGEARLIAAAQGSLSDQRALFRLTSLNIRYPDGSRTVIDVDGWVVGEDGVRGMEGILIDPIGKAIASSGMAGAIEGLGEGFAAANSTSSSYAATGASTVSITGNETEYAAGKGLSGASKTWSRLIESRVNKLVPHVEVLSGRQATAIFSRSFKIPGLLEQYEDLSSNISSLD